MNESAGGGGMSVGNVTLEQFISLRDLTQRTMEENDAMRCWLRDAAAGRCYACGWKLARGIHEGCTITMCSFHPSDQHPSYSEWALRVAFMDKAILKGAPRAGGYFRIPTSVACGTKPIAHLEIAASDPFALCRLVLARAAKEDPAPQLRYNMQAYVTNVTHLPILRATMVADSSLPADVVQVRRGGIVFFSARFNQDGYFFKMQPKIAALADLCPEQ